MKKLLVLLLFVTSQIIMACPGCVGSMENSKQANLVPILMIFIGLTYIPFYLLYRTIIKHRNLNTELQKLEDAARS